MLADCEINKTTNDKIMKTIIFASSKKLTRGVAGLAAIALLLLPAIGLAQGRGATQLMKPNVPKAVAVEKATVANDATAVNCPKCTDRIITVVQTPVRGVGVQTKQIAQHQCSDCTKKFVTEGHGKARVTKAVHLCQNADMQPATCCVKK
jgi:hypothetical protein